MRTQVIGIAARVGNAIEAVLARLRPGHHRLRTRETRIIAYRSVSDNSRLSVRGRVVQAAVGAPGRHIVGEMRSSIAQLVTVYRAFDVVEAPFVTVEVSLNGGTAVGDTDDAGFFAIDLPAPAGGIWRGGWHHPKIRVVADSVPSNNSLAAADALHAATGEVFVPPNTASLVIVSDLDDTAMDTQSVNQRRMLQKVLFSSAQKREAVQGVPELYHALQRGASVEARTIDNANNNPVCYISSGAWNLYDHVLEYLDVHDMPKGAVYLNDWGSRRRSFHTVLHAHKGAHVNHLLTRFASLPFLLIGDDVQEDPELYGAAATSHPNRVRAIWIRVVVGDKKRLAEIEALRGTLKNAGTDLLIAPDTAAFTAYARAHGWIA